MKFSRVEASGVPSLGLIVFLCVTRATPIASLDLSPEGACAARRWSGREHYGVQRSGREVVRRPIMETRRPLLSDRRSKGTTRLGGKALESCLLPLRVFVVNRKKSNEARTQSGWRLLNDAIGVKGTLKNENTCKIERHDTKRNEWLLRKTLLGHCRWQTKVTQQIHSISMLSQ